ERNTRWVWPRRGFASRAERPGYESRRGNLFRWASRFTCVLGVRASRFTCTLDLLWEVLPTPHSGRGGPLPVDVHYVMHPPLVCLPLRDRKWLQPTKIDQVSARVGERSPADSKGFLHIRQLHPAINPVATFLGAPEHGPDQGGHDVAGLSAPEPCCQRSQHAARHRHGAP